MDLSNIKNIYFLGIGGIGMSALARYFHYHKVTVYGYDKTETDLTRKLEAEGIDIHYDENPSHIPANIDLVVYTPAIPSDNTAFQYFKKFNIPIVKRAELLGFLSEDYFTIAVAGSHGKTTITSIISYILKECGKSIIAFIGGISKNFESNFMILPDATILIVEADEFDRSFLNLQPDIAVISSIDADHLDIYHKKDNLLDSFTQFINNIKPGGTLIIKNDLLQVNRQDITIKTYGITPNVDFQALGLIVNNGVQHFHLQTVNRIIEDIKLQVPGVFNVENALAAIAVCLSIGISPEPILKSLLTYKGVERRFDIRINSRKIVFIDDYAHHPEELKAIIKAVKETYPGKKITGIFQPHLYSRTRDFANDFAISLEMLDDVILLPIYPARETPIEGISSEMLLHKIDKTQKMVCKKQDVIEVLSQKKFEVLLTLGAGDIDRLVIPIENFLKTKIIN
ncbi:MAG: UDP-N-acetylmuramate--L-alanine ligase [Bacteroidales bacterium]|nr:UDP-N-acetylmuramate--L-alanine ligase [Bacteroidales bacterium]